MAPGDPGLDRFGRDAHELSGLSQMPAPEPGNGAVVHAGSNSCGKAPAAGDPRYSWASRFQEPTAGRGCPRTQQTTKLTDRVRSKRDMLAVDSE